MLNTIIKNKEKISFILVLFLILISLFTNYYGSTDMNDYAGVAKFFAGEYHAKIRTSHSILYGFVHAPLLSIFNSFLIMKLTSLVWLVLIIISVYYISNKNKKTLFLTLISPVIWYMGPWINPIQLSSLLFLWGFFFMEKYDKTNHIPFLIYSGLLLGLSWAMWNTAIFMLLFLIICYFYNRNVNHLFIFAISVFVGFLPQFILDIIYYSFPFYSTLKHVFGILEALIYGGIYKGNNPMTTSFVDIISVILMLPIFGFVLFKEDNFSQNKRATIFLTLGFLFILLNPQIRYVLILWPVLMLYLPKLLRKKQFVFQSAIFIIVSLLVITPYIIQMAYPTNSPELTSAINNFGKWTVSYTDENKMILEDLSEIVIDYPNQTFIVGNKPDDYVILASLYWGNGIKEFVSIQDYNLYLANESSLFEKKIESNSSIDRRQIWIGGGLERSENDDADYQNIEFAIGLNGPVNLSSFEELESYNVLYLSKRIIKTKGLD